MARKLEGMRVAILVDNGFEQSELVRPKKALDDEGASTFIVSPSVRQVKGWTDVDWGDGFDVDVALDDAELGDFDALLVPGGVQSPDRLRMNERAVAFVRGMSEAGKPIAAICHGPWMLVEAGVAAGREVTSWPGIKTDLVNAGASWHDREVVVDRGVVTSRKPADIDAFNRAMIDVFAAARSKPKAA
jgi:protease I